MEALWLTAAVLTSILEIAPKTIRFYHEMRNDGTETIVATAVIIGVHMDGQIRKACRFPKEIIERAQPWVVEITPVI